MNLREEILSAHSKAHSVEIAMWIGKDIKRFDCLMQLFFGDDFIVVQRSAWILSICTDSCPELAFPYLKQMIKYCYKDGIHVAVKRNVTRVLAHIIIPDELHEAAMNLSFELLADQKETVAVRCWSMDILMQLSANYPDIKNELKNIIEDAMEHQELTAGFKSKARRILKSLK
ncbi:MAG: hypothetical protein V4561_07910 [Bacteroidota bacterium]